MTCKVTVLLDDGSEVSSKGATQSRDALVLGITLALKNRNSVLVLEGNGDTLLVPVHAVRYVWVEDEVNPREQVDG